MTKSRLDEEVDSIVADHESERAAYWAVKGALGAEIIKARQLGYATNGARVTGGYNYDKYRDALDEFVEAHKAANRAWKAYGKVRVSEARRRLVAYHEAGHAVIGRVVGIPVTEVSINPKTLSADGITMTDPTRPPFKKFSEPDVIFTLAGPVAEERFTGKASTGAGGDNEFVRYHSKWLPQAKRKTARGVLKARTEQLVDEHWPEITEVAHELLRVGTVSMERIDAIMDYAPMLW
jgi:hypothetical protein